MKKRFEAKLRGRNEVPPVKTNAKGEAKFLVNKDCTEIKFILKVENIKNFIQAHIHVGGPDVNGPVVAFLFGADLDTLAEQNGITTCKGIVTGVITDEDIVKNDACVKSVRELVKLMKKGCTYVNVHTEQNINGEIRGQIRRVHH
ncbi:CHRD domain-containing protein [Fictibacillus nanhaiensis]|uniref:CHRD domain-containing protein n=1 Tax=Fictibacillus nanhaiensis TaxID=742169 RepID=UPI001C987234|nr:CHRD domain-containing protein [Fictibacillus nanhaiensis]MBY6038196.1 CHRD domain-containing protein [Fictibacillus nanhaiensis]